MSYVGLAPGASYVPPVDPDPDPLPPPPPPDDIDIETAYYISASGSDGNDGSVTHPFATLAHFLALPPAPGTALIYRGGSPLSGDGTNRSISLTNGLSGAAGAPITLMAYPGESPQVNLGANGTSDDQNWFLIASDVAASHWRISGLEFLNGSMDQDGLITVSRSSGGLVDDWTIYGCTFHKVGPGTGNDGNGGVYLGSGMGQVLIERNTFIGIGYTGDQNIDGNAVQTDHADLGGGLMTIRYNLFVGHIKAIQIFGDDEDARVLIEHNTFKDCGINIDLRGYAAATVRNNAGTDALIGTSLNIYDPGGVGTAIKDHNFWAQVLDSPDYHLHAGSTGLKAASDGTDAGWVNT